MPPIMHIVAHQDDDLLFMASDLATAIRSGAPSVTVYLTAGQGSGTGTTEGARARNRQRGVQDAYARMAGLTPVGDQSEWTGDLLTIDTKLIERYTLTGTSVHLVFGALRDGELSSLYAGTPHLTVVPAGGGVPQYGYNRADVVNLIAVLVAQYQPVEVRSLDPLPEARYIPADHADHTTAAKLVADAVTGVPVVSYRGYSISSLPINLAPAVAADKLAVFEAYRVPYDDDAAASGWTERMYYRWPRGATWVGRNADGRLQVFFVRLGVLWTWHQLECGGWSEPSTLTGAGGPLAPTLAVAHDTDGRMEVFARRLSDHHIVVVWQTVPNGGWATAWADLGNHNSGLSNAGQMGAAAVVRNADGRLQLFVKNGGGGVSTKSQTSAGAAWGGWVDLGGADVQDGLSAVADPAGRVHLFAATRTQLLHWYQQTPNGPLQRDTAFVSVVPAASPTAVLGPDGRILVIYRRAGGTEIAVNTQESPAGTWLSPQVGPGPGGTGQVAAAVRDGVVEVFARDADDGVSVGQLSPTTLAYYWGADWDSVGGVADCPAAVSDPGGEVHVFAAGDGQVAHRAWPGEGAWTALP